MLLALALQVCACGPSSDVTFEARAWPAADALFRQDPRWLGADAAYSVDLGGDRVLWLFGDTFVATSDKHIRAESRMIRNTVAIQTGRDPTAATMAFRWRETNGEPDAFFPNEADAWYWPMHGVMVDGVLVLALVRVIETPGVGLGFEVDGWRLVRVAQPEQDPAAWQLEWTTPPTSPAAITPGLAFTVVGDHVVSMALQQPGGHSGHLVRWTPAELAQGDLTTGRWWQGSERGWTAADDTRPVTVLADAGTEASLHFDPDLQRFVYIRSEGFGASTLVAHTARSVEGPWSEATELFVPPESKRADAFVYAGKGHPELLGADLVVTYVANTMADFNVLVNDDSLYYPRFVRVTMRRED